MGQINDCKFSVMSGGGTPPEVPAVFHAATYDPITFEPQQESVGVGGETCTHTAEIYAPDYLGVYHAFGANEPVWEGMRAVTQQAVSTNDLSVKWQLASMAFVQKVADPLGGTEAYKFSLTAIAGAVRLPNVKAYTGVVVASWWARRVSGSGTFSIYTGGGESRQIVPITTQWQRLSADQADVDGLMYHGAWYDGQIGDEIELFQPQYELHPAGTVGVIPSEYVENASTVNTSTASKHLANANGNSVTGNVVTEAVGTLLDPLPMLVYQKASTNIIKKSYMDSSTDVWTLPAGITVDDLGASEIIPTESKYRLVSTNAASDTRNVITTAGVAAGSNAFVIILEDDTAAVARLTVRNESSATVVANYDFNMADGTVFAEYVAAPYVVRELKPGIFMYVLAPTGWTAGNTVRAYINPSRSTLPSGVIVHYAGMLTGLTETEAADFGVILTDGVEAATDEIVNTWAAANHSNAGDSYEITPRLTGEAQILLSMGGTAVLEVTNISVEIIANGGPDFTVTDGWVGYSGSAPTITIVDGKINIQNNVHNNFKSGTSGVTEPGKTYQYEISIGDLGVTTRCDIGIGVTAGAFEYMNVTVSANTTYEGSFVATGTEAFFYIVPVGALGDWCQVTSLSIVGLSDLTEINLSDGTNSCSTPVVSSEPHIKATYNATDGMTLDVDGVTATSAYDSSLGSGDLSTQATQRDLIRRGS